MSSPNNRIVTDSLVYYFDTTNPKSYVSKPVTNIITSVVANIGNNNTDNGNFITSQGQGELAYIPALGKTVSTPYSYAYNNDSANYCCYQLFTMGSAVPCSGGTTYTYSIIYKTQSGYTHPNFMYLYEYGASGYITEYGNFDGGKRIDLGSGWYYAWNTFTTNAATNRLYLGFDYYLYGVHDKAMLANASIVATTYIPPPSKMPALGQSISNTQGLLDLTGNNTLDLTNAGYDNYGNITYNGSNNCIIAAESSALNNQNITVEVWIKTNALSQNGFFFEKGNVNTQYSLFQEGGNIVWRQNLSGGTGTNASSFSSMYATTANYISTSNWAHIVGTYVSGSRCLYINGTLVATDSTTGQIQYNTNGTSVGVFGGYNGGHAYYYNGQIGVVRVYGKVLTATEVTQNFNAQRARYGV